MMMLIMIKYNIISNHVLIVSGEVGDWKNHLTVAQNEFLDHFIRAQEKKGVSHTFQYE